MGIVGDYLDRLPDELRDRVIRAQGWRTNVFVDRGSGERCLIGHAEGDDAGREWIEGTNALHELPFFSRMGIGFQFDKLCERFGKDRVVRAVKARAAKPNRVSLASVVSEAETVGA